MFYTFRTIGIDFLVILTWVILLAPVWIPFSLFWVTYDRWMEYIHLKFSDKAGRVTLEITLPQEVYKSPQAMEEVLSQAWQNNKPYNLAQAYWEGKHALTYSFELVSIGGSVRFYANLPVKKAKDVFEAQLYAQYPGIEVKEVEVDYTAEVENDPEKWESMSFHVTKAEDDVLPIKTYVDWGLDKNPKEEEKIEPMAPILEYLGSVKPHERVWIQILAVPHSKKGFAQGSFKKKSEWTGAAQAKIDEIMQRKADKQAEPEYESMPRLTMGERDLVTHIERNTSKLAYETAMRVVYATPKGKFRGETISSMTRAIKASFTVIGRNDMAIRWRTDFDYNIFSDYSGRRRAYYKKMELDFYKMRVYLPRQVGSGADRMKVMSVEEIATMWHIPGKAIVTPGLARVESLRQDAPANLPVGNPENPWS
jgi:hypothetical protein